MCSFTLFPHLPSELRAQIWNATLPGPRILEVSFSLVQLGYTSSVKTPVALRVNRESRAQAFTTYGLLHLGRSQFTPVNFPLDTLYLSGLGPILQTHKHDLLYDLSTSGSRHMIRSLAIDRRVWIELCEHGLLGILCRMKALREVLMVVEFGRDLTGELGFLEAPAWRADLKGLAERAVGEMRDEERKLSGGRPLRKDHRELEVRCVLLTKGAEQA